MLPARLAAVNQRQDNRCRESRVIGRGRGRCGVIDYRTAVEGWEWCRGGEEEDGAVGYTVMGARHARYVFLS